MARSTRFPKSKSVSGVTFATILSGVTIDANGLNNSGLYPVSFTTSGCSMSGGSSAWAGTTLSIEHGMTNLLGFSAIHYDPSGVSVNQIQTAYPSPVTSKVSVALVAMEVAGGASTATSGGTIYWMAIGN